MNIWERARANGYISGLKGAECRRLLYPGEARFAYDAGRRDGLHAREELR